MFAHADGVFLVAGHFGEGLRVAVGLEDGVPAEFGFASRWDYLAGDCAFKEMNVVSGFGIANDGFGSGALIVEAAGQVGKAGAAEFLNEPFDKCPR